MVSLFWSFAPLVDLLNCEHLKGRDYLDNLQRLFEDISTEYHRLPTDLQWSVQNFRTLNDAGYACVYTWLHLWSCTMLAAVDSTILDKRPPESQEGPSQTSLWRSIAARNVSEIMTIADVIAPAAYLSLPLVNQPLYIAACFYADEIKQLNTDRMSAEQDGVAPSNASYDIALASSRRHIAAIQEGLRKLMKYWSGIAWILDSLEQRINGASAADVNLEKVTQTPSA